MTGSEYEWSHHWKLAAKAGLSEVKVTGLARRRESDHFDERERAALLCVERLHDLALDDGAFEQLRAQFDEHEVIELVALCGFYEAENPGRFATPSCLDPPGLERSPCDWPVETSHMDGAIQQLCVGILGASGRPQVVCAAAARYAGMWSSRCRSSATRCRGRTVSIVRPPR
ncbi:carboxymuconolactone decarboxylase family protein [Frankia sp. Cas3]|uniref:carboxymuconolactone decarboxylase family protein n=1 Tax=Frankia sp. Cas3 TaxID=3073926 RepID=UPI003A1036AF